MRTTWLPHLLTNTITLLFPDLVRMLFRDSRVRQSVPASSESIVEEARQITQNVLLIMVRDNPQYVTYMIPLAAGYILSHPRWNIYKGDWANIRIAGFGLDALPHSLTAL